MRSTTASDHAERLNLAEQVARIERTQVEIRKLVAEHEKLVAEREKSAIEGMKLVAGREKLSIEAIKLARGTRLAPLATTAAVTVGAAAVAAAVFKALGLGP